MKKVFPALVCLSLTLFGVSAHGQSSLKADTSNVSTHAAPDPNAGKFEFDEETYDFGEIEEGPIAQGKFTFKNVGKNPIIISDARGTCGCTIPMFSKKPVGPKEKGTIHVSYTTLGRVGPISKDVFVTSNAQQSYLKLHITGYVKPKPENLNKTAPMPAPPPPPAPESK
jgi:hypothetical protein